MKAQLVNKLMPAESVTFDFNPEKLTMKRQADTSHGATGKGSTPGIFRGSKPTYLSGAGWLEGSDVKNRSERLLAWCEPGGGLLGKAVGAALGALSAGRMNLSSKLPVLIFTWGPFLMECHLDSATVDFERFDRTGAPTRAKVTFALVEEPSLLGLLPTNPTSGGLPGRKRHVVSQGDTLALIAAQTYGHPGLWRAIAEANGIDDPFRMTPGRVLLLPGVGELSTAGA